MRTLTTRRRETRALDLSVMAAAAAAATSLLVVLLSDLCLNGVSCLRAFEPLFSNLYKIGIEHG